MVKTQTWQKCRASWAIIGSQSLMKICGGSGRSVVNMILKHLQIYHSIKSYANIFWKHVQIYLGKIFLKYVQMYFLNTCKYIFKTCPIVFLNHRKIIFLKHVQIYFQNMCKYMCVWNLCRVQMNSRLQNLSEEVITDWPETKDPLVTTFKANINIIKVFLTTFKQFFIGQYHWWGHVQTLSTCHRHLPNLHMCHQH